MRNKLLAIAMLTSGLLSVAPVQAAGDGPWLVRARAVSINFANGQADSLESTAKVEADNLWIPEVDISYFFTKNIAAELVLTYPQGVDIKINGVKNGKVDVLPPSLLLQYHFTELGAFKPYVGAGVNYTIISKRNNILNGAASLDRSSTGLVAQVGFDYALTKEWSLNFDVKYAQIRSDVALNGAKIGKLNLDPTMYGIGIGYRF